MQGLPPDNELESSFNMGFGSILTVLQNMESGQNTIIALLNKAINMFDNIADNIGTTFNTSIGKLGIGGLTNYNKMIYQTSVKSFKILDNINKVISNFAKNVKSIDNSQNMNFGKQEVKGTGNTIYNAKEIFNLNILESNNKKVEIATGLIKEINKFFTYKKDYQLVQDFFTGIRKEFYLINNVIFKVGQGFAFLTASLIAITFVNYASIVKLATLLPAVGLGLFIFIVMIKKAFSSKGPGGMVSGLRDMFKTWSLMKMLPELLTSLGKGALFLSVSLILFNAVGYDAILKMGVALLALGFSVKMMVDSQGLGLSMTVNLFLIATLITITTVALFKTASVKWDSVFKLPTFMLLLGWALKAGQFDKLGKIKLMSILSASILLMVISLTRFKDVSWENTIKLNIFIAGLGLSLRTIRKDMSVMTMMSIGMMLLTASLVDFQELNILSIIQIIGVVGLIGVVVNKFVLGSSGITSRIQNWTDISGAGGGTGFGLMGFAVGLAFMAGSIRLLSGLSWKTVGQAIVFIAALGATFKLFFSERRGGILGRGNRVTNVPSMIGFGIGLGIMVLALDAVSEIEWKSVIQIIVFIIALALSFKLMGRNSKTSGMLGYSLGIGIMVLALDAMSEIEWESVFKMVFFTIGLAGAFKLMGPVGAWKMIAFSFSVSALAYVLYQVGTKFNQGILINIGIFALSVGIMTGLIWLLGKVTGKVASGILAAGGIALVSLIMVKALSGIKNISDDWQDYVNFLIGVGVLAAAVTVLGLLMMIPGAQLVLAGGAIAMGAIALVSWLMAKALESIASLNYDPAKFKQFAIGMGLVVGAFIQLNPIETIAAGVVSLAVLPIMLVSLAAIGIMKLISIVNFDDKKIALFGKSLSLLVNTFNDNLSLVAAGKASIKSVAILPLLGVMLLAALLMNKINKLDLNENVMNRFNSMFKLFINNTIETIKEKANDIKNISPALKSIAQLMNMGTTLARTVGDIANLKFYEFTVKDGKLVLSNVRSLTPQDFTNVGISIGKLINALISPLNALGSNSDSFMIGSESIPNPFKSNKMVKGMEMVKKISEVFKPLVDAIKSYSTLKISFDKSAAYNYVHSLKVIVGTYVGIFRTLNGLEDLKSKNALTFMENFNEIMDDVDISKFKSLDGKFGDFINKMSDSRKWKKIHYNTAILARNLHSTARAINSINLEKAAALENNVKLFVEDNNAEKIKEVVESFKELFLNIHDQRMAEANAFSNNFALTQPNNNVNPLMQTIPLSGANSNNGYNNMPGVQEINNSKTINNNQTQEDTQQQMSSNDVTNYKLDKLTNAINNLILKMK